MPDRPTPPSLIIHSSMHHHANSLGDSWSMAVQVDTFKWKFDGEIVVYLQSLVRLVESGVTLLAYGSQGQFGDLLSGEFACGNVLLTQFHCSFFLSQTATGLNHASVRQRQLVFGLQTVLKVHYCLLKLPHSQLQLPLAQMGRGVVGELHLPLLPAFPHTNTVLEGSECLRHQFVHSPSFLSVGSGFLQEGSGHVGSHPVVGESPVGFGHAGVDGDVSGGIRDGEVEVGVEVAEGGPVEFLAVVCDSEEEEAGSFSGGVLPGGLDEDADGLVVLLLPQQHLPQIHHWLHEGLVDVQASLQLLSCLHDAPLLQVGFPQEVNCPHKPWLSSDKKGQLPLHCFEVGGVAAYCLHELPQYVPTVPAQTLLCLQAGLLTLAPGEVDEGHEGIWLCEFGLDGGDLCVQLQGGVNTTSIVFGNSCSEDHLVAPRMHLTRQHHSIVIPCRHFAIALPCQAEGQLVEQRHLPPAHMPLNPLLLAETHLGSSASQPNAGFGHSGSRIALDEFLQHDDGLRKLTILGSIHSHLPEELGQLFFLLPHGQDVNDLCHDGEEAQFGLADLLLVRE